MNKLYDIAIIGCGPAGLSAAVNSKIRNKDILVFSSEICSAKMHKSPFIFNYLGFSKVTGEELRQQFLKHAKDAGVKLNSDRADSVISMGKEFNIVSGEKIYRAKSVIVASGISLGKKLKGETEYLGKGVGYCATCDAPLYTDRTVALVSYNKDGEEEANFLSEICKKVYYIPMYKDMGHLDERIELINDSPVEIVGDKMVSQLILKNSSLDVEGVFIIKDTIAPEELVPGLEMDGPHIKVDRNMRTNIEGIYAAGDCAGKPYQLSKAAGEGQIAALHAVGYLAKQDLNKD